MNLEVSKEELGLIKMLLRKEKEKTRFEIHRATTSFAFKDYLKQRDTLIANLLARVKQLSPECISSDFLRHISPTMFICVLYKT